METDKIIEKLKEFGELSLLTPNKDVKIVNIDTGARIPIYKIRQMLNSFCERAAGSIKDAKSAGELAYVLICNQLHTLPVHLVSAETMSEKKGVSWKIIRSRDYDENQPVAQFGNDPDTGERVIYICPSYLSKEEIHYTSGGDDGMGFGFLTTQTELVKYLLSYNLIREFAQSLINNDKIDKSKLTPEQKEIFEKVENAITDDLALKLVKSLGDEQLLKEANEFIEEYGDKSWSDLDENTWLNWKENKTDVTKYPKFDATKEELMDSLKG